MDRLVAQRQHVIERVEMAYARVNIGRLDRIATPELHGVERLTETQKILIILVIARTTTAVTIRHIRRARNRAERDGILADHNIIFRIARVKNEALRRKTDF